MIKKLKCHCGEVEAEVKIPETGIEKFMRCNCSLCKRKGYIIGVIGENDFKLIKGEKILKLYQYYTKVAKHYFCKKHNIDPSQVETHFGLLKRTAKRDNVEIFRVTSGEKKTTNALTILNYALYSIDNKKFPKKKSSCDKCEFFQTEHCK